MRSSFDVLVVGGGPSGSAAAIELSRRGLSVALIEQDHYEKFRVGETLPPMIRQQLTQLGVWQRFLESGPLESFGIQTVWESPSLRHQDFIHNPYGCGWHVDRARFDALLASAAAEAGAEWMLGARVTAWSQTAGGQWQLEIASGAKTLNLNGRMLVDATGRKALLSSKLGSQAQVADQLVGVVALIDSAETARWTLIEAVEDGWWYSAPLPHGRMVLAFMTDSDLWKDQPRWGDRLKLAEFTSQRAGRLDVQPRRHIVSAASVVHFPVAGANWLAIGDAALAFDPLSGQGIFKAMETGIRCSSITARYLDGDPNAFAEYEAWVATGYEAYLSERTRFYRSVTRWPESRFWKRRS
jgi:flavin-dependent dehydrogenase